ncbi:MAG: electron transfer flavoprotein subunit beta [Candidatus Hydrothermota bacterium]|nr:MAG: electron transfer flavoprotein subunit beta [Candidatus Hydrothermae bacterium]
MNIVVCIKQVPDTQDVKMDPERGTLIREGVKSIVNPFDLYAIEEGLRIKERMGKGRVVVMTMGPPQAEDALREAIAMGADHGILISDRAFAGADTLATSYTLAKSIEKLGSPWIIICGKQAMDGDTAQVGPELATWLNFPQITYVSKIIDMGDNRIKVERLTDYGYDIVESSLPCVITVNKEINEPRLPSLRGMMKAKKFKAEVWDSSSVEVDRRYIGLDGSPTRVVSIFAPPVKKGGEKYHGEPDELARHIARKLEEIKII